ncbi:thermostable hemolysin [Cellvibrio sp. OA-2007]|uniref:thermostable hemolysin n=1 Tax=Cellvibrio sp. OA-2007 TaxID=529823 RepID=UPI00078504FC|nr:thermostable hemolysin [Cellvibrio sp. OA-2007]
MKHLSTALPDTSANSWHMPRLPQIRIPRFGLQTTGSQERAAVEAYIQQRFAAVHKAQVNHFLPNIISLRCGGEYSAAVGLAPASNAQVFAEQYLYAPVEQVISEKLNLQVARDQIVEIGNLVSTWKGSSLLLFIVIGEVMERLGYHYVMFTGTREVKALLARLRYSPIVLADADPARLADGGASWGSYYQNKPQVMFGDNRPAMAAARKNPMYRATVAAINRPIEKICTQLRASNQPTTLPQE